MPDDNIKTEDDFCPRGGKRYINPYRLFIGAFIPNWLLRRQEITSDAKLVYARMCQYSNKQGVCFPSQKEIASEIGIENERRVRRYLKELKKWNLIESVRIGKKCTNRYVFPIHEWMEFKEGDRPKLSGVIGQNCPITPESDRSKLTGVIGQNCPVHSKRIIEENHNTNTSQVLKTCDDAYKLSNLLFEEIIKNNPYTRLKSANKEQTTARWAKDIDLLIRKDKQEPSTVEEVIRWSQQDGFWGANILSGNKLREKWDTLTAQKKRRHGNTPPAYAAAGRESKPLDSAGRELKTIT